MSPFERLQNEQLDGHIGVDGESSSYRRSPSAKAKKKKKKKKKIKKKKK